MKKRFDPNGKKEQILFKTVPVQRGPEPLPHSIQAEKQALGCILLAAEDRMEKNPMTQVDEFMRMLDIEHFYHIEHRQIFTALQQIRGEHGAVSAARLDKWRKEHGVNELPGLSTVMALADEAPSAFFFRDALKILEAYRLRRLAIERGSKIAALGKAEAVSLEEMKGLLSDMLDVAIRSSSHRGQLKVWRFKELMEYEPPTKLQLVGDNEIRMGYEGLALIAGPGASGKSMALTCLGFAGALGTGTWMGRKVHRKFRTLYIQAENGASRLKKEMAAWHAAHPRINIQDHIFMSDPPEGGIPFHRPEFRANLRRLVDEIKPDLVVLDPWSQMAVEDQAKEVVDKIAEVRSCLPAGDDCPGVMIAAHTKKPRAEDVKKGRALAHLISGSVALPNTARAVYMLLPWDDAPEEDRVYFCCAKLNDGAMYPASVWHRRFGTFFEHDPKTNANDWGDKRTEEGEERRAMTLEMFQVTYEKAQRPSMRKNELVKLVATNFDVSEQTVYRSLQKDGGYATTWFLPEAAGMWALRPEHRRQP
jgi:hypothetical protein